MSAVSGRRSFHLLDGALDALRQIAAQPPHQQPGAFLAAFGLRILTEAGDRAADAVLVKDQLKAFARLHAIEVGDLKNAVGSIIGSGVLDRLGHRADLADGAEVRPGALNLAVGKKQTTHLTRGFDGALFVGLSVWF